jgi:phosphatidylglycerol:prolipoprotein diacylglycerol transferase
MAAITAYLFRAERRSGFTVRDVVRVQGTLTLAITAGMLGYAGMERGWEALRSPGLHTVRQIRYPGLLLGCLLVAPFLRRLLPAGMSLAAYGDLVAPAIAFTVVGVRLSCLLAGCCFGYESSVPWAITYPADSLATGAQIAAGRLSFGAAHSLPVHPLQVYLGLWALAVGLVLQCYRPRKTFDGQLVLMFLALHETGKGVLEFLRPPLVGGRHLAAVSFAFAALGVLGLVWHRRHAPQGIGSIVPGPVGASD